MSEIISLRGESYTKSEVNKNDMIIIMVFDIVKMVINPKMVVNANP